MSGYGFGPFELDRQKRTLRRDNQLVSLTPKVFDLLCVLIERRGAVVEKEEILRLVWPDTIVEEGNLSVNISMLRRALGDTQHDHRYIVTLPGRGYSFVAEVVEINPHDRANYSQQSPRAFQQHFLGNHNSAPATAYAAAMIEPLSGALPLDSPFYIARPVDDEFFSAIARSDSIILVKGARQVGKTSLLARGLQQARQWGAKVILTDFQYLNAAYMESVEKFFLMLAELIADQLVLKTFPGELWNPNIGPSANFERYWRRVVLAEYDSPIVWGLDEVDRLFPYDFASEVFGLFRSWHNKRALDPAAHWNRVTLVMTYATEAHLFITDLNQSPFNVGTQLFLDDFNLDQVRELNERYSSPLNDEDQLNGFFRLVNGHPYLSNRGLWEMKTHRVDLNNLALQADRDDGVFSDHLRRVLVSINHDPEAVEAVRALLSGERCLKPDVFYRLRSSGAITGHSVREAELRCELYRIFLQNRV